MLTAKQEAFARNIALEDMNYSDAYRSAYNTSGMTDKTVNEKASKLKDSDKIRTRIAELREASVTPKVISRTKREERLSELAVDEDPNVAMKAIDLLNKMQGVYVQKVEANVNNKVNITIELSDD